jgi:hypothetical protein
MARFAYNKLASCMASWTLTPAGRWGFRVRQKMWVAIDLLPVAQMRLGLLKWCVKLDDSGINLLILDLSFVLLLSNFHPASNFLLNIPSQVSPLRH